MKLFYTLLAGLSLSASTLAQDSLFVTSAKLVYEKPNSRALEQGVLLRGAKILVSPSEKDSWYVVDLDNQTKGYITKDHLGEALFGHDQYTASPHPIIDMDDYFGSPHLFTTHSKTAVYKQPKENLTPIGTLSNATPIALTYYPFDQQGWVNIGSFQQSSNAYIKQHTLGARPVFSTLKGAYLKATQIQKRKQLALEMLELSWANNLQDQHTALEYCIDLAEETNELQKAKHYKTLLKYVHGALNPVSVAQAESFFKIDQAGFVLNGVLEPAKGFTKSDIEIALGKRIKVLEHYNECAGEQDDVYRLYTLGTVGFNDTQRQNKIFELKITDQTAFRFQKYLFTSNTSMDGFVEVTQGYLSYYDPEHDVFKVETQMGGYDFYFTNGKLSKVVLYYYC